MKVGLAINSHLKLFIFNFHPEPKLPANSKNRNFVRLLKIIQDDSNTQIL